MKKQPLLILLLCFLFGIIFQDYFPQDNFIVSLLLAVSGVFLSLTIFKISNSLDKLKHRFKNYLLGFFFFSIGVFVHFQSSKKPLLPILKAKENIVFRLNKKLNSNEKSRKYFIDIIDMPSVAQKQYFPLKAIVAIPKTLVPLDFKHYYKASVYIHQPDVVDHDFQFDYKKYLARQDVYYQAYILNEILRVDKWKLTLCDEIKQKRLNILNQINQSSLSPKIQEFLKGIILADRTEMDSTTVRDFNQTGLVHLLAISGSHMVIIFWITLWLLGHIISPKLRFVSVILSLLLIWIFAIFIDYGSSVMRSCLMISCYYIMVLLQRKPDLLHSLALSAFIILMVDSQQLFDVGFQLSYVAVLGIWWLTKPIQKLFRKPTFWIEKFFYDISAMTLVAQISTLPLAIYYFHQFSFVSVIANLAIIPLSEVIIISSLVIVIFIAFGFANIPYLYHSFDVFVQHILKSIHWFSGFDALMSKNISLNILELILLLFTMYVLRFVLKSPFDVKNILRLGSCLLSFFLIRISFNIYQFQKSEMLTHHFYKESIISIKDKNYVVFWMKPNKNETKIMDFIINPYLTNCRVNDFKINYIPKNADAFVYEGKRYNLK